MSMQFYDIREAVSIAQQICTWLLGAVPPTPASASVRTACGDVEAHADDYIIDATLPTKLLNCFRLTTAALPQPFAFGSTFAAWGTIRLNILALTPATVPGTIVTQLALWYTLAELARCIAATNYVSRQDVATVITNVNAMFEPAEEMAADLNQGSFYLAIVSLHAATTRDLVARSLRLPNVVAFDFRQPVPTLWAAQRLYCDGKRADELRAENHVVHPAFMLPQGVCLSQ